MAPTKLKGAARPEDDQNDIASPNALTNIMTAKIGKTRLKKSDKDEFVDTGIIAERRYNVRRKKEQEIDFLVEGLPFWRRHGSDNGVDEGHLAAWKKLKADKNNVVQGGIRKYDVTIHRRHPLFERWTGAEEIFENGLKHRSHAPLTRENGGDDDRDRKEAMEMLGHMLGKSALENAEDVNVVNDLATTAWFATRDDDPNGPRKTYQITYGQAFLQNYSIEGRQDVALRLLTDENASKFHSWTLALCIAILPMKDFLEYWQENTATISRGQASSNRLRAYRLAISSFLDDYHQKTRKNKSFIYTLRTYSTLSEMLRTQAADMLEDAKKTYGERDRAGDNEDEEEVRAEPDHNDTSEGADDDEYEDPDAEYVDPDDESEEEEDEEELQTNEKEIREIEEAAKKDAARPEPGKRNTRPRKRKTEDPGALGDAPKDKKRRKTGGLWTR